MYTAQATITVTAAWDKNHNGASVSVILIVAADEPEPAIIKTSAAKPQKFAIAIRTNSSTALTYAGGSKSVSVPIRLFPAESITPTGAAKRK